MATITEQCQTCAGTGLYTGLAEKLGAAVICKTCKGKGAISHTYIPFTGRKPPPDGVLKVFAQNPSGNTITQATPGGADIAEWRQDPASVFNPGKELRHLVCPSWWFRSSLTPDPQPLWDECAKPGTLFQNCPMFPDKRRCWQRWDAERHSRRNDSPTSA